MATCRANAAALLAQMVTGIPYTSATTAEVEIIGLFVAEKPGALVLLLEGGSPLLHWPLGRVQEIHPGKDGAVRVVTVKTFKSVCKRGVSKVCAFPTQEDVA